MASSNESGKPANGETLKTPPPSTESPSLVMEFSIPLRLTLVEARALQSKWPDAVSFSVLRTIEGCEWEVRFRDGTKCGGVSWATLTEIP